MIGWHLLFVLRVDAINCGNYGISLVEFAVLFVVTMHGMLVDTCYFLPVDIVNCGNYSIFLIEFVD